MFTKRGIFWLTASLLTVILSLSQTYPSLAEGESPDSPTKCITCHENLYYLHDTGKHYCISEASQRCTDCHEGDPTTTDKEAAHQGRSAHPVINGDTSKCQECHPNDCAEHVVKFNTLAGIQPVVVAIEPSLVAAQSADFPQIEPPSQIDLVSRILAGAGIIAIALAAFIISLRHQN